MPKAFSGICTFSAFPQADNSTTMKRVNIPIKIAFLSVCLCTNLLLPRFSVVCNPLISYYIQTMIYFPAFTKRPFLFNIFKTKGISGENCGAVAIHAIAPFVVYWQLAVHHHMCRLGHHNGVIALYADIRTVGRQRLHIHQAHGVRLFSGHVQSDGPGMAGCLDG